jgi:hypothetical protein
MRVTFHWRTSAISNISVNKMPRSIASSKFAVAVDRFPQPKDRFGDPICRRPPKHRSSSNQPTSTPDPRTSGPLKPRARRERCRPGARVSAWHPGASSAQAAWEASLPGFAGSAWAAPQTTDMIHGGGEIKINAGVPLHEQLELDLYWTERLLDSRERCSLALRRQRSPSAALLAASGTCTHWKARRTPNADIKVVVLLPRFWPNGRCSSVPVVARL